MTNHDTSADYLTTTHRDAAVLRLSELNGNQLATLAGVSSPDSLTSPGADWLDTVRLSALELWDYSGDVLDPDRGQDGGIAEAADGATPAYVHHRMLTLVDLAAYREDVSDLASGSGDVDLVDLAALALYLVADRLIRVMLAELIEARDDDQADALSAWADADDQADDDAADVAR